MVSVSFVALQIALAVMITVTLGLETKALRMFAIFIVIFRC